MDKNVDKSEFVKRLSYAIENCGLRQIDIADKAGITEVSVSRYKDGIRIPKGNLVGKICEVLGITPNWLYGFEVPEIRFCPYCGRNIHVGKMTKQELDSLNEIASIMDEKEFETFCSIWREKQGKKK